ncbi:N-acetyltransferase [Pontibacillus sp. HMF3514]|uniref:GNAT family N-acetyltransferase n=1 Tax=Pontibacillus sp. HMF3514 TaxID=2692425 RepID=UPI0013204B07|nr:GNAT family N-acetyltransferase [Pontibacillus sp. HMF3514]QHE53884.1 GNAT family N-acetyltransferase [Pontibacillus sp. HMF3514]
MIKLLNHHDPAVAQLIGNLQQRSYQLEADILGVTSLPPFNDGDVELKNSEEHFIGYVSEEKVYGFASYEELGEGYLITRLGVDPDHLRKGIGTSMLKYFEERAMYPLEIMTGKDNIPAVRLYEKHGFEAVAYAETEEGIWLVKLRKEK